MKICIDTQSTLGHKTGIGLYTQHLIEAVQAIAPHHHYYSLNWGQTCELRTDQRLRWQQLVLPKRAKAARADVLHTPGFDAPRFKPCPTVLTVHDLIGMLFPENLPPVARFYWSWWLPHSIRWADHIIADSEHTRRDIVRLLGVTRKRITVIPLGVGPQFHPVSAQQAAQKLRTKHQLPQSYVLYLGTLEPRKGIDTLIESYALISGEIPQDLVIAGKRGWFTEPLFELVQHRRLEDRVHFTGYISDERVPALLSAADVFAFPSRYEGFGLPALEAMACGTPVIASNASSLPEVVGDAGLMVPPDDIPALAQALSEVLGDRDLQRNMRERGLARARCFTWEETARKTLQVYEELAG
ncbi:MAG: glycosyltransferase family 4 protein [Anaerolineae bacterium]|nr:glycosyltransferase family 4 protein [Anaerolineae bacterium]